ncbi:IclR family transcriptional regulator C-terminal domain-containing protein [Saccharothrix sp. S26]|uniref:IclR family transcriptional regulator domain-containing protein n=1 Tax=Saccharothrix sp. S26 TaxID=2907215 RepID=UPI0027E029E8|nr:IclR family transcriptional regulator C-terminal domain-containing protein [Saccharothrix sp. S26]
MPDASTEAAGTFERGLAVLHAVATHPEPRLRRGDLAKATGLPRSTVDRVTATLLHLGYLRAEGPDLRLALDAMRPGNAYLASCGLVGPLAPLLTRLADELDESVTLTAPDVDGARLIAQSTRRRAVYLAFHVGAVLPDDRTAAGVVLATTWDEERFEAWRHRRTADPLDAGFPAVPTLAGPLPDREAVFRARVDAARARGWSLDDQWVEPGLLAVSAPVRDPDGRPVAAVNVLTHTSRHTAETFPDTALPRVRAAIADMEAALRESRRADPAPRRAVPPADDLRSAKAELGMSFLEGLARGLAVLTAFRDVPDGHTIATAAEACGLARATARRALHVLCGAGYARTDGRRFALRPKVLDLGYARLAPLTLSDIAQPHLADLAAEVGESASMAVLDGDQVRYVARVATGRVMRVDITIGTRFPAVATSMGRVLLAGLPAVERAELVRAADRRPLTARTLVDPAALEAAVAAVGRDGWAMVDEELHEGLRSLAVAVRDTSGAVVAAVNVALHVGRATPEETARRLLPALRSAAARIEADLAVAFDQAPLVVH